MNEYNPPSKPITLILFDVSNVFHVNIRELFTPFDTFPVQYG